MHSEIAWQTAVIVPVMPAKAGIHDFTLQTLLW
jgi:hypothetical protein